MTFAFEKIPFPIHLFYYSLLFAGALSEDFRIETEPPPDLRHTSGDKGCAMYVLGEFRGVRRHGEEWRNGDDDGSNECQFCRCHDARIRCFYHYCNSLTVGYITPPSKDPILEEGSGNSPFRDDEDDESNMVLPSTALCPFPMCQKYCTLQMGLPPRECEDCKCPPKCKKMNCFIPCPLGYILDTWGCPTCHCVTRLESVQSSTVQSTLCNSSKFCVDEQGTDHEVGSHWTQGPCVSCTCILPGHSQCNVTQCPPSPCPSERMFFLLDSCCPLCDEDNLRLPIRRVGMGSPIVGQSAEEDFEILESEWNPLALGTKENSGLATKSRVTSDDELPEAAKLLMILLPLSFTLTLLGLLLFHWRRRKRYDKYDVNSGFRSDEAENLRPTIVSPLVLRAS